MYINNLFGVHDIETSSNDQKHILNFSIVPASIQHKSTAGFYRSVTTLTSRLRSAIDLCRMLTGVYAKSSDEN